MPHHFYEINLYIIRRLPMWTAGSTYQHFYLVPTGAFFLSILLLLLIQMCMHHTQYISFHIEVPIRQVFSHHLIRHDAWWWDMYYNATTLIILCFFWHDPKLFLCHNAAAAAEEEPKSVLCILYCASDYWREAFFFIDKFLLFPLTWGFNTCDFILLTIYCNSNA